MMSSISSVNGESFLKKKNENNKENGKTMKQTENEKKKGKGSSKVKTSKMVLSQNLVDANDADDAYTYT